MKYQVIHVTDDGGCFGPVQYQVDFEYDTLPETESMLWLQRAMNPRHFWDYKIITKEKIRK